MKLASIRSIISTSSPDDWHKITCWGGGGPSFLTSFATWTGYQDGQTWGLEVETHTNVAVYEEDVNLRVAWGWNPDHQTPSKELDFPWQTKFANTKVTQFFADIFWAGSLVDRMLMFSVDGARAVLPSGTPSYRTNSTAPLEPSLWITDNVTDWEYGFARLVHSFEHAHDFARYFEQAGFTKV